jgi:hypothetical protein
LLGGSARSIPYPLPPGERGPLLARGEFGQRSFGTVFGLVGVATQAGVALGPGPMGLLHDARRSSQTALWCLVALEGVAAASVLGGRALQDDP